MSHEFHPYLHFISTQQSTLISQLEEWAKVNSFSYHLEGLSEMSRILEEAFIPLGCIKTSHFLQSQTQLHASGTLKEVPLGQALVFEKRPEAQTQVLLIGHMDTVFAPEILFDTHVDMSKNIMFGPGVSDMKGGLLIMLTALTAFEKSPLAHRIGWKVLINPDEEVGSTGSFNLLLELANRCDLGLIFEPSFPDGSFVSARKGSSRYSIHVKGKSGHVGRNYAEGRNAIHGLASFIVSIEALSKSKEGLIISVGYLEGGGPSNIIPDSAYCTVSVRADTEEDLRFVNDSMQKLREDISQARELEIQVHLDTMRPPKPFTKDTEALFDLFAGCSRDLGLAFSFKPTGGVCDGNIVAQTGLPTIDTLGAMGGKLHTIEEYVDLPSLIQRSQLTVLFLLKLASGDFTYIRRIMR